MGLFSDDLEYRDLDALCIKVRRSIGNASVELPIYVDVRISYVTWNNAKEVIIDGSTVKDLKKNGRLLRVFKPIFERYIIKKVNEYPEYAEYIFPDDFFGEKKLEFNEKRAKELISSRLFKDALTLIDDPGGFEEIKFEKIYGIAPVVFKVREVSSGVSMPYDYSEMLKCDTVQEIEEEDVDSAQEQKCEPEINDVSEGQEEITPTKCQETDTVFDVLSSEYEDLKRRCKAKQEEIRAAQQELDGRIQNNESLAKTLSEQQALIEQIKPMYDTRSELWDNINTEKTHISRLAAEKSEAVKDLKSVTEKETTLDYLIHILCYISKKSN